MDTNNNNNNNNKTSQQWRQEGNQYYKQEGSLLIFEKCLFCYNSALQSAISPQDRVSALKNLAATHHKMFCMETHSMAFNLPKISHHLCEMISYFNICISEGRGVHPLQWNQFLATQYSNCLNSIFSLSPERKNRLFWRLTNTSSFSAPTIPYTLLSKIWVDLARSELLTAIRYRDGGNLVRAHHALMNSQHPFQTAKKYSVSVGGDEWFAVEEEIEGVGEQIKSLEVSLESGKLRQQGLNLLKGAMDAEEYDVEQVWLASDYLKQAILTARGSDLEAELMATAEIGRIYASCLQLKVLGRTYFHHVITSAEALKPRIVHSESWYQMAMNGLNDIRGELWEREEAKRKEQKKPILEKLKNVLDVLEKAEKEKNVYEFMSFLFDTHPPKIEGWKKPEKIDRSTGKNVCRKACVWYHPDKNQKNGLEWEVLCEEISKMVSRKYAIFKE